MEYRADTTALKADIDKLVYTLLYRLTAGEIDIVERKR